MDPIRALLILLAIFVALYLYIWYHGGKRKRDEGVPGPAEMGIGFVTNFFDTLGIGSYAPTTAIFKAWKMVKDEWIPGTLNVGHTLPTVTQAFIFIGAVTVDVTTLFSMIAAAVVGAFFGAKVVASWPRRYIQIGMGSALLVGAGLFAAKNLGYIETRGEAAGVAGAMLLVGILGNLVLGALMTIGIGLYAPCMLLVAFIGMNERSAFPIMMGSCAFLMPGATKPFVDKGSYNLRVALGLAIGGIPGVLLASRIVTGLPIVPLRWMVSVVVLYTGLAMLRSAHQEAKQS
jgi:uncharacterized membrane protein YfcA